MTRTPGLLIRSQTLYPTELRAHHKELWRRGLPRSERRRGIFRNSCRLRQEAFAKDERAVNHLGFLLSLGLAAFDHLLMPNLEAKCVSGYAAQRREAYHASRLL